MSAINASFATQHQDFPAGTVASHYVLTLTEQTTKATLTGTAPLGTTTISVSNVPAGTYDGTIALVDGAGAIIGAAVQAAAPVTVAAPATVALDVPASLSLSAS